jgi:hypothetical protein
MTPEEVHPKIEQIAGGIEFFIQPCCATTGDGLYEGLDWAVDTMGTNGIPGR